MSMKIITGRTGTEHINSCDDGALYASVIGDGDYVLEAGSKFAVEIVNNNTIQIGDGELLMQGRHGRIVANDSDTVTIENGAQGIARCDTIVCEYSHAGGIEDMSLKVLKGTPGTDTPPKLTKGNLRNGDNLHQMALYHVHLNGLEIESVDPLYKTIPSISDIINKKIKKIVNDAILANNKEKYPVGRIFISTFNINPEFYLGFGTWVAWGEGRFPVGVNKDDPDFSTAGKTGGEKEHVLSAQEMPHHMHTGEAHTHSLLAHTHSVPDHTHTLPGQMAQYSQYGSNIPTSASASYHLDFDSAKSTIASGACTTGGANGDTGSASADTSYAGGGTAHNNLPPYITCYMFKRIA